MSASRPVRPRSEKATSTRSMNTPEMMAAHRPTAPAETLRAVWLTEPPTGVPLEHPDGDVGPALGHEVGVLIRPGSVGIRVRLSNAGPLHQHDHRNGECAGE